MDKWTPLWGSLLKSTVWVGTPKEVKILWITMLGLKDEFGIVISTVPGLAKEAELTMNETRAALKFLSELDDESSNKEQGGRRILKVEGGWRLVSHFKYRDKIREEYRRAYQARKQREYREQKKAIDQSRELPGARAVLNEGERNGPEAADELHGKIQNADYPDQ